MIISETIKNLLWLGYGHGCTPQMAFDVAKSQGLYEDFLLVVKSLHREVFFIRTWHQKTFEDFLSILNPTEIDFSDFVRAYLTNSIYDLDNFRFHRACGAQLCLKLCLKLKAILEKQIQFCQIKINWGSYKEQYLIIKPKNILYAGT